jgi:hypothetical protein
MKYLVDGCPFFQSLKYCIIPSIIVILVGLDTFDNVSGLNSPQFERQEVRDDNDDWVNMLTGENLGNNDSKGPPYTDINSINYFSDGNTLNATFWLSSISDLTTDSDISNTKQIYYGILIDSDFNNDTGYQGIDYQVEIKWNDTSKKWNRSFNEFSANGHTRNLTEIIDNHVNFLNKKSGSVIIDADLKPMLFPDKYRLFFYAYSLSNGNYLLDAVRWVYVPPPEFTVSTQPEILVLVPGEKKNVDVLINSTTGFQPVVRLDVENIPKGVNLTTGDTIIPVPPYGFATTTLSLNAEQTALPGSRTFFILANISFLNSTFYSPITNPLTHKNPILKINSESIMKRFPIVMTIANPVPLSDIVKTWLTEWFNPLTGTWTTLTTIATGILGWRIWKRQSKRRTLRNKPQ